MRFINKYLVYIIGAFIVAVIAIYQYEQYFESGRPKAPPEHPQYSQCENVYVRKTPHPCQEGDLIYIDSDVADKYCTDNIITRFDDSVYCQYNGFRDDLPELSRDSSKSKKP